MTALGPFSVVLALIHDFDLAATISINLILFPQTSALSTFLVRWYAPLLWMLCSCIVRSEAGQSFRPETFIFLNSGHLVLIDSFEDASKFRIHTRMMSFFHINFFRSVDFSCSDYSSDFKVAIVESRFSISEANAKLHMYINSLNEHTQLAKPVLQIWSTGNWYKESAYLSL